MNIHGKGMTTRAINNNFNPSGVDALFGASCDIGIESQPRLKHDHTLVKWNFLRERPPRQGLDFGCHMRGFISQE